METLKRLDQKLDVLSVFSAIGQDTVWCSFRQCLYGITAGTDDALERYGNFLGALYNLGHTDNWTEYVKKLVLSMETPCSWFASRGQEIPAYMEEAARQDLRTLSEAAAMTAERMQAGMPEHPAFLPCWQADAIDLEALYFERLANVQQYGFGIYANYRMFRMEQSEREPDGFLLKPVKYPDAVSVEDLIGYELQRKQVIENTKALLRGRKAANVLLYGDAGTGKSASVKAIANAYADRGLRLIELGKEELHLLPKLLDLLSSNPLKFILFIDDLSFQDNDDDFSALKAVLEGSVAARSHNTVIYATSNRRHIVRETFSAREGDEVHRQDTMQETISLSERFGIKVYFEKPKKDLYLEIVYGLAQQYGLSMDRETLALEAERFALRKSGRSARAARQLIEQLSASVEDKE
ncbi:MAG: ATP-binding protein [Oscillospiraceae bacterium]|nr:ATP-binding protein [Oscillospiraceae bacterium]